MAFRTDMIKVEEGEIQFGDFSVIRDFKDVYVGYNSLLIEYRANDIGKDIRKHLFDYSEIDDLILALQKAKEQFKK